MQNLCCKYKVLLTEQEQTPLTSPSSPHIRRLIDPEWSGSTQDYQVMFGLLRSIWEQHVNEVRRRLYYGVFQLVSVLVLIVIFKLWLWRWHSCKWGLSGMWSAFFFLQQREGMLWWALLQEPDRVEHIVLSFMLSCKHWRWDLLRKNCLVLLHQGLRAPLNLAI
jgi:hypothetical protein